MNEQSQTPQSKVRHLFGVKSAEYNTSSLLTSQQNLKFVIEMVGITHNDKVLDVATGTGFMAIAIADTGAQVIATDFTLAMLKKASESLTGQSNTALALADADLLPFASDSFDVVTCRVSVHHFANPQLAIREMSRVCKPDGRVMIMDVISSEDRVKSDLHNKMGKLRDLSEVRQWQLSEIEKMINEEGLTVTKTESWSHVMAFDEWIRLGGTDQQTAERLRGMMIDSMDGNKAGLNPEFIEDELVFTWMTGIVVAQKII